MLLDNQLLVGVGGAVAAGAGGFLIMHACSKLGVTYHPDTRQVWVYFWFTVVYTATISLLDLRVIAAGKTDLLQFVGVTVGALLTASVCKLAYMRADVFSEATVSPPRSSSD